MHPAFQHIVNSRVLTSYHAFETELKLNKNKNYLFDASFLALLTVTGDKAREFLQGQLSCDVNLVSNAYIAQGAQCNLKGRILSLLDVVYWDTFKLVLPKDLADLTQNSLNKTAQLSRVALQTQSDLKMYGFYLQNPDDLLPAKCSSLPNAFGMYHNSNYCCYNLGGGFYFFIIQAAIEEAFCKPFGEKNQLAGSLTWHTLRLYNQHIDIYPESRGLFLPHRLDLHQTPYINFNKGCYKGQEIIARTHYKATLKHALKWYVIETEQKIYSGQKLFKPIDGTEIAELIDYSPIESNKYLIAVSILKGAEEIAQFEGHSQVTLLDTVDKATVISV